MKKYIAALLLSLLTLVSAPAASLVWEASLSPGITGYTLYENSVIGPIGQWNVYGTTDADTLNYPLALDGLPHFFYVTARSGLYESDPSNILEVPGKPVPPADLRLIVP